MSKYTEIMVLVQCDSLKKLIFGRDLSRDGGALRNEISALRKQTHKDL